MTARLPTVFLSHGSPMQAVGDSVATDAWAKLGCTLPRPAAVLIASAHWETSVPMLTGHSKPETIHDFGGFAPELYRLRYPAPGAPALAASAVALLKAAGITAGINGCRGLDHGAWVPLLRMFPDAGVPVAQISVQPGLGTAQHIALGRALAPLAADGVLVIGSGHATHNLRDWVLHAGRKEPLGYAAAFADWLHARLTAHDTDALIGYREHGPEAARAHPSEEHFLPLLVAWGAADPDARVERFVTGWETAALALDSWLFHPPPLRAH